jgi:hypothetical protein
MHLAGRRRRESRQRTGFNPRRDQTSSEEEVALVGFAFRPPMSAEAHFFGVVSTELVTKELTVWSTPRLRLSVHDWQALTTERATRGRVGTLQAFTHLLSPDFPEKKRRPRRLVSIPESVVAGCCENDAH